MLKQPYRYIRELVPKPSDAIRAMCRGLRTQAANPQFVINMDTYGGYSHRTQKCYGCAATCALHEIGGRPPCAESLQTDRMAADYFSLDVDDIPRFEYAIDKLRRGCLRPLFALYGRTVPVEFEEMSSHYRNHPEAIDEAWILTADNWEERLPMYDNLADELEKLGC